MNRKFLLSSVLALSMGISSGFALACGGPDSGQHIGNMVNVNPQKSTFTIRDMETNSPITFNANPDIMKKVKQANGDRVMVKYEESDDGSLTATQVAF